MPDPAAEPPALDDELGPEPLEGSAFDSARYRQVLGHFATGVTVVTGTLDGQPMGLSVNSFTSVSLAPPLVAFCIARTSTTWPRLRARGHFCVNILAEDQEQLARVFATRLVDKFTGVGWTPAPSGSPVVLGALAWLDCTVEAEHEAGDHLIVVGRANNMEVVHEAGPLIFYRGGYGRFEP